MPLALWLGRVEFKLHDGMDACGTGSEDCESVSKEEDEERGEEDSHQLDSSSMIEARDGEYSCPMRVSCCLTCLLLPSSAL